MTEPLYAARDLARLTLSQGDEWLPYEETWHPIAVALICAVDALEQIANGAESNPAHAVAELARRALA